MTMPKENQKPVQPERRGEDINHDSIRNIIVRKLSPRGEEVKDSLEELKRRLKKLAEAHSV